MVLWIFVTYNKQQWRYRHDIIQSLIALLNHRCRGDQCHVLFSTVAKIPKNK